MHTVNQGNECIYVFGDGDKVREKVEYYLLNNEMDTLREYSLALVKAIKDIEIFAVKTMNACIVMAGGDDILFYTDIKQYKKEYIQKICEIFFDVAGGSISFGIGKTIEKSYINLRKAKASKKEKIIEEANLE